MSEVAGGWTERDTDGLDGWVALVDGRIVLGARPGLTAPEPVVHAEAWEAGSTLHAALAQHPTRPDHAQDEDGDQEHALLGDIPSRVRRRAVGMTLEDIQQAVNRPDSRNAAPPGTPTPETRPPTARPPTPWPSGSACTTTPPRPGQSATTTTTTPSSALRAERHRQDVAECAREAAHQVRQTTDAAHHRLAGTAAQPLYTALDRAGLSTLTDDDHQAVRGLTKHLDAATLRQVTSCLERTRTAALARKRTLR
ncbi:hypothetical protein [Kitasatospora sp. NPDC017646]|uniref:hypothetical protein n=1 Tax=Kitasatospora sp. NPDC017646 TaxID=3364024 RepID=UPI00379AA525